MDIIMKEIDVLSTFYENADLDEISQTAIYLEAGTKEKINEVIENIGYKIKYTIKRIHEFYHEIRLKIEEMCINKRLSHLVDDTVYQINAETKEAIIAYNAKKLILIYDQGVKKLNHVRIREATSYISPYEATIEMRKITDKTIADIKSASEEILSKSTDKSLKRKIKVRSAHKKDIEQVMKGYWNEYMKITMKLEKDCASNIEHLWGTSKKKKEKTALDLRYDQYLAENIAHINKTLTTEISKIFTTLTKQIIVASPSDTLEINLKRDRDMATVYGTAIGVKMALGK